MLFAVSIDQTVRLSLADGSVTKFSGHTGDHFCFGHAMALSDDENVLYIGHCTAQCVVAYDVATLQLMWKTGFETDVLSIAHHDGLLLSTLMDAPVVMLSAADGSVVRMLGVIEDTAWGISVLAGLGCVSAVASLLTPCRSAILESQVQRLAQHSSG